MTTPSPPTSGSAAPPRSGGLPAVLVASSLEALGLILRHRKIVWATTRFELAKRYAGSVLGMAWVVLQPTLLLSIYLFTYLVVFKVRFPGMGTMDYVLYVFCGLTPFLGVMEAVTSGCTVLKQNLHLVKNVLLPIELLPVRVVMVSMTTQLASLSVVILLVAVHGDLSLHLLWLPAALLLQMMMLVGVVWIVSVLTVALPDLTYFINLGILLLMFLSPIGFKPEMVPGRLSFMIYANPIYYLTEMYRSSLLYGRWPEPSVAVLYVALCIGLFAVGSAFFRRFKDALVDYD